MKFAGRFSESLDEFWPQQGLVEEMSRDTGQKETKRAPIDSGHSVSLETNAQTTDSPCVEVTSALHREQIPSQIRLKFNR